MTPDQARERILASTRFSFHGRKVLVRDVALLELLRDGKVEPTASHDEVLRRVDR